MNKLKNVYIAAAFICAFVLTSSCGDDADPIKLIDRVAVFEGGNDEYRLATTMRFVYNDRRQLIKIETASPVTEVNYTYYSEDSISYSVVAASEENMQYVKVGGKLSKGRYSRCYSNKMGYMLYSYEDKCLSNTMINNNIQLNYEWKGGNLKSIHQDGGLYNSEYTASKVSNDCNIDLNALLQFIDRRPQYLLVMNTYAQLIELLGKKSKNIVESKDYNYDYAYNSDRQLTSISLTSKSPAVSGSANTFSFKISYK
ncbi:MAG: hypothetical protein RR319_02580 [Bacteroides sp.]